MKAIICFYQGIIFDIPFPSSGGGKCFELDSSISRRLPPFPQADKEFWVAQYHRIMIL